MKKFILISCLVVFFTSLFAQPPGSPKDMPGSDTSTVEMDGGKPRNQQKLQRSDTARMIPGGPKRVKNKK